MQSLYTMHFSSFWLFARLTNNEGGVACLLGPSTRNGLLVLNLLLDVDAGREICHVFSLFLSFLYH